MRVHRIGVLLAAGVCSLALSSPVLAHIDPDPTEAQAGSNLSVGFTVEHGCDGSPTTSLDMRLPDGVTEVAPEAPDGWAGSITDNAITFEGGPLPDDQQLTFNVALTLPSTPDTTIYFPFVQRCDVGEIRWIDVPSDGSGDEPDEPAPAMALTGPVASSTAPQVTTTTPVDTTVAETSPPSSSASTTSTETTAAPEPSQPATTAVPTSTLDTTSSTTTNPNLDADDGDGTGSDGGGAIVALAVGGLVLLAGGAALLFRRRRS